MSLTKLIQYNMNCVTFYITQLKGDGLYLMTEIDHLRFPLFLNELPQLLRYVDRLYDILNVFEELCMLPMQNERHESKRRETIKSPTLHPLIEKTVDRSRINYYDHSYHYILHCITFITIASTRTFCIPYKH